MKNIIYRFSIVFASCPMLGIALQAQQKPNVLLVVFDDLRPEIGAYGEPDPITPNIDRLANEGIRFENAYVNYPLCLPSRASLLTGIRFDNTRNPDGTKADFNKMIQVQQTWPGTLKNAGYWTAASGKIYHGNIPGNDETSWNIAGLFWKDKKNKDWWPGIQSKIVDMGGREDYIKEYLETGNGSDALAYFSVDCKDDDLNDGKTANDVIEYIKNKRDKSKPFLVCAGFSRPHMPWVAPKKYFDMYPENVGTLAYVPKCAEKLIPKKDIKITSKVWNEGVNDSIAKRLIRGYMASTTYADAQMGRIITALKESGEYDNTIIIVWGDHGYHLTDHGLWRKNTEYHVAMRCPLIIKTPGVKGNQVRQQVVKNIDIYPTLLELCGVQKPENITLHGSSLVSIMKNNKASWLNETYTCANKRHGIITDKYRFTQVGDDYELYDLKNDPDEWNNLATKPEYKKTVDEFIVKLDKVKWNNK